LSELATNTLVEPISAEELKRRVIDFVRGGSTELAPHDEGLLPALANKLPAGTTVYVAHTPKASLEDVVRVALKIESLGLRASPHIAARRLKSYRALRMALRELRDGGVEQVLLIAGDLEHSVGIFPSCVEVMDTGALAEAGFRRVGVAGHPEGHKAIGPTALWGALRSKQEFAERTGIQVHIVTQFGFNPQAVCTWGRHLTEHGISLPLHVGLAGPTSLPRLIKFAMHCGVAASLHSLMKSISAMSHAAQLATSPDEMLVGLIGDCAPIDVARIVQPHFYSFGGAVATARWLRAVMDGSFELRPGGGKFVMNG
jgi:methylenetetrahydrofolate reductase (NADPH)